MIVVCSLKDLDLVWFGGLSGVQARLQTPNSIVIAQRDIDKEFKSVFIVNKNLELTPISNIKGLKKLKNLRFTFICLSLDVQYEPFFLIKLFKKYW